MLCAPSRAGPTRSAAPPPQTQRSSTGQSPTGRSPTTTATAVGGMAVTVGRLRPCEVLDYKMVVLSHNTIRGAAGGSILNAELMIAEGLL